MKILVDIMERGWLPDSTVRWGIRQLLKQRIAKEDKGSPAEQEQAEAALVKRLESEPVAVHTDEANEQHYEVPTAFYETVLGPRLKYSSCLYPASATDLAQAEEEMLRKTCDFAQLEDGQRVLELGCGWGSLSLWMAEQYPASTILAVSNSATQRAHIEGECKKRNLTNLEIRTANMQDFACDEAFDRIVSVEMFEHMRNYKILLERISHWLKPDGKLFVHIFCHKSFAYLFETEGAANWMGRYFFTGGTMPSENLLRRFDQDMTVEAFEAVNGVNYARTLDDWLERMDQHRDELKPLFEDTYGKDAARWWQRWRMFFMACSELFAFRGGDEWYVGHYRFSPARGDS